MHERHKKCQMVALNLDVDGGLLSFILVKWFDFRAGGQLYTNHKNLTILIVFVPTLVHFFEWVNF